MARRTIKTTEDFIRRAVELHGDMYDYSKVIFVSNPLKVIIGCKIHGDFEQPAGSHLQNRGCTKCGAIRTHIASKKDINHFLKRAKDVHGDRYDYSKSVYAGSGINITIVCKTHGEFQQTPENHYAGKGCERCSRVVGQDDFIQKAKIKHSNYFSYDKVVYINSQSKVIITCPKHGDFEQVPTSHTKGHGCISCKNSVGEEAVFQLLKERGINFISQHTFPDLRLELPLRVDFYLPDINTVVEFDGIQHQVALEVFGGEEGLRKRQRRDRAKVEYCAANNIRLVRIWYNQNPEEILRQNRILT